MADETPTSNSQKQSKRRRAVRFDGRLPSSGRIPSQTLFPESAIRSTLDNDRSSGSHAPFKGAKLTSLPPWHPQSDPLRQQQASQSPRRIGRSYRGENPPPADNYDDDCYNFVEVDTDNRNDWVYLINASAISYSGTLLSEDEPSVRANIHVQTKLAIQKVQTRQNMVYEPASAVHPNYITTAAMNVLVEGGNMHAQIKADKDLRFRNAVRHIKRAIQQGGTLVVETLVPFSVPNICAHPICPVRENLRPPTVYFVILRKPQTGEAMEFYCLACVERIWTGRGMFGRLPPPQIDTKEVEWRPTISSISLDGAYGDGPAGSFEAADAAQDVGNGPAGHRPIPKSLLQSKHAMREEELAASSRGRHQVSLDTPLADFPGTPRGHRSSPDSMTSEGEWVSPPTRFQHIAAFIRPGTSLNDTEKAVVQLWKAVSMQQIEWEEHRARYKRTMQELREIGEDSDGGEEGIEEVGNGESRQTGGSLAVEEQVSDVVGSEKHGTVESSAGNSLLGTHQLKPDDDDKDDEIEEKVMEWGMATGLTKKSCFGRNLSKVLEDIEQGP